MLHFVYKIIEERHPNMATVAKRLVEIYFLLSAGAHEDDDKGENMESDDVGSFLSLEGRLISTR